MVTVVVAVVVAAIAEAAEQIVEFCISLEKIMVDLVQIASSISIL
jgi:hypothetical protein